ncbi:MAG TPA: MMPL family transporter [Gemmataceae bacterium]|nr:MMPL family transporter [Gemmataceae bacterium]
MFNFLGRMAAAHPWRICAAWLIGGVLLGWVAPGWNSKAQDDDIRFLPERCPSVRGYQLLSKAFPQDVFASKVVVAIERPDGTLTKEDFALADDCAAGLERLRTEDATLEIGRIASYRDALTGSRLTSADRQCTLIQVPLATPFLALQTRTTVDRIDALLRSHLAKVRTNPPRLLITGPAGIGRDLTQASAKSLDKTTIATIILVVVILLFVYRAPLLALVPLITIVASVWISLQALALLTLIPGVYLVNVSRVFAVVILYGAGTDYCLFLISRYTEELEKGENFENSLRRSIKGVGGALAASAGTVICGLGLMGFAEFAKVRCAGPAIGLSLAVALCASLTLAPALLRIMGGVVFWPRVLRNPGLHLSFERSRLAPPIPFWDRISRVVVARPLLVWSVAGLILLPFVVLGLRVSPVYRATGELHPLSASVQGLKAIQRHFTAGEIGPLTVLLEGSVDWDSPEGREVLAHLSRGFAGLENVAEVRSLTQPLGRPLPDPVATESRAGLLGSIRKQIVSGALGEANRAARKFYVAELGDDSERRFVTRLDVVLRSDPFDAASLETLELIEVWLAKELPGTVASFGDVRAECYSATVNARDLANVTEADRTRVDLLVLGGIFLILLVLVRRPWLAAYLLLTVLVSYYATLGATALVGTCWSGRPLGEVDWRVPFFLFTILVAVGEDYNILLISRLLQERKRHGTVEGTRRALARTGGTITSCGLIMAGTFATLMLGGLGTLVQIGFALSFGVLVDTFVVRPFLVPAFAVLVWRGAPTPTIMPAGRSMATQRRAA